MGDFGGALNMLKWPLFDFFEYTHIRSYYKCVCIVLCVKSACVQQILGDFRWI